MDQQIERFVQLLEQTEFHYRSLLPLIDEEKEAAVQSDINRLTAASCEKQSTIDQIRHLDGQLKVIAEQLARRYQIAGKGVTLSVLAEQMPPQYSDKILKLNNKLNEVVKKVQSSNEQCCTLMQHCLRLVHNTLGFFQHWMGGVNIYGATGNIRTNGGHGRHFMSGMV